MTKTTNEEIEDLRQQIGRIRGRIPASRDLRYLRDRLAELKLRKTHGEDVRRKPSKGARVVSVSMPSSALGALERILAREKVGASTLVRRALAAWASSNGYPAESDVLGGE